MHPFSANQTISDTRNFFMYVISAQIGLVISNHVPEFCLLVLIKHKIADCFFTQISLFHCANTLDFDIAKR